MTLLAYHRILWSIRSSLWEFHTHVFAIKERRGTRVEKLVTTVSAEERSRAIHTGRQILCTDNLFPRFAAVVFVIRVVDFSPDPVTVFSLYIFRNYCFSVTWDVFAGGNNEVRAVMFIA